MSLCGFQILPTGTPWIPNLVHTITDVALNGKRGILIDQKLIEGPNANDRGKLFIPLILAFQVSKLYIFSLYFCYLLGSGISRAQSYSVPLLPLQYLFVIKPIQKLIKNDAAKETKSSWA